MTLGIIHASDFADAWRRAFEQHDRAEFNIADHGVTKRRKIKFAAAPMSQERPAAAAQKRRPPAALQKHTPGAKRRRKTTPIFFWLFLAASSRLLASESATEVAAAGRAALKHRDLGLFAARDFDLTTGKCADCPTPRQARWYFEHDLIAVPKKGLPVAGLVAEHNGYDAVVRALKTHRAEKALPYPPAVWIGAKDLLEHASVSADGKTLTTSGGTALPLELVPRLATNRSYFDRSHDFSYHHSKSNCTGITMDALRALGWHIPRKGPTGYLNAAVALAYLSITEGSFSSGKKMFDYLSEEKTRLFPRAAFEAAGEDLLGILSGQIKRPWTDYERALRDDAVAVLFIGVPQIPSSRAFGTDPVASFEEYRNRLPADRSQWRTVAVDPRPFPDGLRDPLPRETSRGAWGYLAASIAGLAFFGSAARLIFRRRFTKGNLS
jgi:hypothetical protein